MVFIKLGQSKFWETANNTTGNSGIHSVPSLLTCRNASEFGDVDNMGGGYTDVIKGIVMHIQINSTE
jgi:hypothetical protein